MSRVSQADALRRQLAAVLERLDQFDDPTATSLRAAVQTALDAWSQADPVKRRTMRAATLRDLRKGALVEIYDGPHDYPEISGPLAVLADAKPGRPVRALVRDGRGNQRFIEARLLRVPRN